MSLVDDAGKVFEKAGLVMTALERLGQLVASALGRGDDAAKVLARVQEVMEIVHAALAGARPLADVKAELAKLRAEISSNDAAADRAVDDKFPVG